LSWAKTTSSLLHPTRAPCWKCCPKLHVPSSISLQVLDTSVALNALRQSHAPLSITLRYYFDAYDFSGRTQHQPTLRPGSLSQPKLVAGAIPCSAASGAWRAKRTYLDHRPGNCPDR